MTQIFIIHGTEGSPESNWFPWLKEELENLSHLVFVPKFSTPEGQNLNNWLKEFEYYIHLINDDTIFIGHSLGSAFILNILEKLSLPKPIKACFLVAGFIGLLGNNHYDELIKTFTDKKFDWDKIINNCNKFYVISSDNDPYLPSEKGRELAKNLKTELINIPNAGHINAEFGFTKFDLLLNYLKKEI